MPNDSHREHTREHTDDLEKERDEDIIRKLREYADNERTIACLRERLRSVKAALEGLELESDKHLTRAARDRAEDALGKGVHNVQTDLSEYVRALNEREQLARFLKANGHGALVGN